ncbi:hypothetical protein Pan44_02600 [Caulifigura coniformis]|uniref:Uncharacterized protein n=1 Tax=Caulifigura coniformis TaxID=2527983 RepID=A0A517S7Z1_9PLAN|nr:hypothetical protein [Caulifigura coniformis]QDT52251.1 hypothetical protein Pan44_02600 [Caulifigura coniformis]
MSRVITKQLENRPHFVTECTLLVEGIHNGSGGPLYYPADELQRSAPRWNGIPIVLYHPVVNGVGVSAMSPEVFTNRRVGFCFGARMIGNRLVADAWLDVERLQIVDYDLFVQLNKGEGPIEVSTGLFTSNSPERGIFNGVAYTAVARTHLPDHLALLPGQVGACSVDAGCGLLRNSENRELDQFDHLAEIFPFLNDVYEPETDDAQSEEAAEEDEIVAYYFGSGGAPI